MVQAMRALVIASKVDQALKRAAPLHAQAKGDAPLTPRGVLPRFQGRDASSLNAQADGAKPLVPTGVLPRIQGRGVNTAKEQTAQGRHRTRWGEIAREQGESKPSTSAPLRPRGILGLLGEDN